MRTTWKTLAYYRWYAHHSLETTALMTDQWSHFSNYELYCREQRPKIASLLMRLIRTIKSNFNPHSGRILRGWITCFMAISLLGVFKPIKFGEWLLISGCSFAKKSATAVVLWQGDKDAIELYLTRVTKPSDKRWCLLFSLLRMCNCVLCTEVAKIFEWGGGQTTNHMQWCHQKFSKEKFFWVKIL